MKHLYIIGNGFDIFSRIRTRYVDFTQEGLTPMCNTLCKSIDNQQVFTQEGLTPMCKETVAPIYLKMAHYAAGQCTGCSDSPMILAFKAQQAMLEAHEKGKNPLGRLNAFIGTSIRSTIIYNRRLI